MSASLDRIEKRAPGSGLFELGAVLTPEWLGARAVVESRLNPTWSAFAEGRAGRDLSRGHWDSAVMGGIRATW